MKYLILAGMFAVLCGCASYTKFTPVESVKIVKVEGLKKDFIYNKARQWFSEYFVSGESVIDYENKEEGTIIGSGSANLKLSALAMSSNSFSYSMRVDIKDGKLRVTSKPIRHTSRTNGAPYTVNYVTDSRAAEAAQHMAGLSDKLKAYILKTEQKSDW